MKYLRQHKIFESIELTKKDEYLYFKLNNSFCKVYFNNDIISNDLPNWAKKEAYLDIINNNGEKGNGKILLNFIIKKLKDLGADILTLRVDNGLGFSNVINNRLYLYYKSLGFKDLNELEKDGSMYMDLR